MGVDQAGTDNSTNVTLQHKLFIFIRTRGNCWYSSCSSGGTGATTAAAARTALGVDQAGTDNSTNVTLATVTDNYFLYEWSRDYWGHSSAISGGTGATTAAGALQPWE